MKKQQVITARVNCNIDINFFYLGQMLDPTCVPAVFAARPWKFGVERGEEIQERPG